MMAYIRYIRTLTTTHLPGRSVAKSRDLAAIRRGTPDQVRDSAAALIFGETTYGANE